MLFESKKCLRINWLLNIYRRGHESATSSFSKKKAHDLCVSIASTWELRNMSGLTPEVREKLNDNLFVSFSLLIYFMLYGIKSIRDRLDIIKFLRQQIPNLKFTNGMKQIVTSFLFNHFPYLYISIRQALKWCTPRPNFGY